MEIDVSTEKCASKTFFVDSSDGINQNGSVPKWEKDVLYTRLFTDLVESCKESNFPIPLQYSVIILETKPLNYLSNIYNIKWLKKDVVTRCYIPANYDLEFDFLADGKDLTVTLRHYEKNLIGQDIDDVAYISLVTSYNKKTNIFMVYSIYSSGRKL